MRESERNLVSGPAKDREKERESSCVVLRQRVREREVEREVTRERERGGEREREKEREREGERERAEVLVSQIFSFFLTTCSFPRCKTCPD